VKTKRLLFDAVELDPSREELRTLVERTLRRNRALIARRVGRREHMDRMAELSERIVERAGRRLREDLRRCR
jgi:hypothetical protein